MEEFVCFDLVAILAPKMSTNAGSYPHVLDCGKRNEVLRSVMHKIKHAKNKELHLKQRRSQFNDQGLKVGLHFITTE